MTDGRYSIVRPGHDDHVGDLPDVAATDDNGFAVAVWRHRSSELLTKYGVRSTDPPDSQRRAVHVVTASAEARRAFEAALAEVESPEEKLRVVLQWLDYADHAARVLRLRAEFAAAPVDNGGES